ncbi:MAG: hypothetical protein NC313_09735 [Butyrivibrio sp.]|nr:hypothetical protein [Butyrivibrio sp.]
MKKWHKALLAFLCSFLICNLLYMAYGSGCGFVSRQHGATEGINIPNTYNVHGTEGYSIIRFDKNGYNNINGELEKSYVLLMGSSHVEGIYLAQEKNMTYILNKLLGGTNDRLRAYSIGCSGNYFPKVVKGFQAGISEFQGANAVIIEVNSTSFSMDDLQDGLNQTIYDPSSNGNNLVHYLTAKQKMKVCFRQMLPLARHIVSDQLRNIKLVEGEPFGLQISHEEQTELIVDASYYNELLNQVFTLIREEYENPIIIFYHPEVELNGSEMLIVRDEETYDIFKDACEQNGIIFADMGETFEAAYESSYIVPYGFANTEMGQGHLNEDGHAIIAHELYHILMEMQEVQF